MVSKFCFTDETKGKIGGRGQGTSFVLKYFLKNID